MRLCSESVLLIRREDVLKRITADSPLPPIDHPNDPRWKTLNVEGTIKAVLSGKNNSTNSMYTTVHSLIIVFQSQE